MKIRNLGKQPCAKKKSDASGGCTTKKMQHGMTDQKTYAFPRRSVSCFPTRNTCLQKSPTGPTTNSRLRKLSNSMLFVKDLPCVFFSSPVPSASMPGTSNGGHGVSLWQGLLQDQACPLNHPLHASSFFHSSIESHQKSSVRPCEFLENDENWLMVSTPLKNIRQNGSLPQIEVKIKNLWNHHPENDENEKIFFMILMWTLCFCVRVRAPNAHIVGPPFRPARQLSRPCPGDGTNDEQITFRKNKPISPKAFVVRNQGW